MSKVHSAQSDRTAHAVLEKEAPPAPAVRESDWPDYLHAGIYFETEIVRDQMNVGDSDEPVMKITGRVPIRLLSRFEYKMLVEFEALLNAKAKE